MKSIATLVALATLAAPAAAQQLEPRAAQPIQRTERTPPPAEMKGQALVQGFSVVLVLGDLNGGAAGDVPPAARKALNDMKDFLPYKGYRLLDAEWILGSRGATTRLRGADGQDYELRLTGASVAGGRLHVSFQMLDGGPDSPMDPVMQAARGGERAALEQRLRESETELAALRARGNSARAEVAAQEARIADLKRRLESPDTMWSVIRNNRRVIDTSFDMEVGETVVVGTSRLKDSKDSGRALIALLTAVPRGAGK